MKAFKINNAVWLPEIAGHIEQFCKRAHVEGIQAGNLQAYFALIAQGAHYGDNFEFWMVFDDSDKPVAFACWQIAGFPNIAKVYCLAMYSWSGEPQAVDMLIDECINFGERKNCVFWSMDAVGKGVAKLFTKKMRERGFIEKQSNLINIVFRRE